MPPTYTVPTEQTGIQCYCIAINEQFEPSRCPSSPTLTFESALSLAQISELPLQILREEISTMVDVPFRVWSSNEDIASTGKRIVCGMGDEVQREFPSAFEELVGPQENEQLVNRVGVTLILFLIFIVIASMAWKRYRHFRQRWRIISDHEENDGAYDGKHWDEMTLHENDIYVMEWIDKNRDP